jgi:RNA polymerase sigma-70 factor (ECF subfamily)
MLPRNDTVIEQDLDNLYRDHHHWLLALLQRRLGNRSDAADLAHDVFVRLLNRPQSFTHFDGARAYLSTLAKGLCIDLWRRRDIEQAYLDALASQPEPTIPLPSNKPSLCKRYGRSITCCWDCRLRRLMPSSWP